MTERFSFKPAGRVVNTVMLWVRPGGRPGCPWGSPSFSLCPSESSRRAGEERKPPRRRLFQPSPASRWRRSRPAAWGRARRPRAWRPRSPRRAAGRTVRRRAGRLHCCRERLCWRPSASTPAPACGTGLLVWTEAPSVFSDPEGGLPKWALRMAHWHGFCPQRSSLSCPHPCPQLQVWAGGGWGVPGGGLSSLGRRAPGVAASCSACCPGCVPPTLVPRKPLGLAGGWLWPEPPAGSRRRDHSDQLSWAAGGGSQRQALTIPRGSERPAWLSSGTWTRPQGACRPGACLLRGCYLGGCRVSGPRTQWTDPGAGGWAETQPPNAFLSESRPCSCIHRPWRVSPWGGRESHSKPTSLCFILNPASPLVTEEEETED